MSSADPNSIDLDHIIAIAQGDAEPDEGDVEHRRMRRVELVGPVAFVQTTNTGGKSIATVVECRNIGCGGMCIASRHMLHVGFEGAVLMPRPDGEPAIVGVRVTHCKYVGDMLHEAGLAFTAAPANFCMDDFRDEQGHLPRLEDWKRAAA